MMLKLKRNPGALVSAAVTLVGTVAMLSAVPASAGKTDAAYSACKQELLKVYGEAARVSLDRVRDRRGKLQVQVKVTADGERFKSTCNVHRDGQITFTSPNGELIQAVATGSGG